MGHYDSAREYDYKKRNDARRQSLLRDIMDGKFECAFKTASICNVNHVMLPYIDAVLMLEMLKEIAVAEILKKD